MDKDVPAGTVLAALLGELSVQGFGHADAGNGLQAYPVHGNLDVQALAEAVENALGGGTSEDSKSPAELNAANDG
jgi:hypothetical protein